MNTTLWKTMIRRAARLILSAVLVLGVLATACGEGETLMDKGITVRKSTKNPGENNPLYTQRFGADPGVMEYNGRLYVFMTADTLEYDARKKVKENSYSQIRSISCISSEDLVNWTDHGLIRVAGSTGAARWAGNSWAPCAAHKTLEGREQFFLYFCNGGNGIGVLTADSPTGPWRDPLGKPLVSRKTPNCADVVWLFDPAVFVDEDGTGYLAFGGGVPEGKQADPGTARLVRLGEDMISLAMDPITLHAPWMFEDSGLNKIGDQYVYSYCSNWQTQGNPLGLSAGAIQYMTADQPLGPYTYRGELFQNPGKFFGLYGNNHHSIACLRGEYYLFYHSRAVEKAQGITGNYRSPQADRLAVEQDGSLRAVVGTMRGVSQRGNLNPFERVPAAAMADQAGNLVIGSGESVWVKGKRGSWLKAAGVDFAQGARSVTVYARSDERCALYLLADDLHGEPLAVFELNAEEKDSLLTLPVELRGIHDLYFVFDGEVRFDFWQAEKTE